ncbi:hypothetical protein BBF96_03520 [Anoxybacter fermentans]|uniref:Phage tail protein n=1 Tax=Anoxybacter fermentans TaxID=1323375 RepID=A0A3Q9HPH6_9FIRM|nr:phage tail tube protein [Anoxybacter fermentans]AZR72532.1 hypothetical protein BBF96_03520 [Anoxybacter fermentans]
MAALGRNSVTAIGEQTAKGTEATTLTELLATSNNLETTVNYIKSEALTGKRFAEESYIAAFAVSGSIGAEVDDNLFGLILKHALGSVSTVANQDGTYTHTFKPGLTLSGWLTFIKMLKDEGYYEKFVDCRISQLSLNLTSQAILTCNLDILGITGSQIDGTAITTANTGNRLFAWDTTVTLDGADATALVDEFSFQHNNGIKEDDYGLSQYRRTLDAENSEHTFNMTLQFDKTTYLNLKNKLASGAILPLGISVGSTLQITYPKAKLTEVSAPITGGGKILVNLAGEALWDSTQDANVVVDLTNDVASY